MYIPICPMHQAPTFSEKSFCVIFGSAHLVMHHLPLEPLMCIAACICITSTAYGKRSDRLCVCVCVAVWCLCVCVCLVLLCCVVAVHWVSEAAAAGQACGVHAIFSYLGREFSRRSPASHSLLVIGHQQISCDRRQGTPFKPSFNKQLQYSPIADYGPHTEKSLHLSPPCAVHLFSAGIVILDAFWNDCNGAPHHVRDPIRVWMQYDLGFLHNIMMPPSHHLPSLKQTPVLEHCWISCAVLISRTNTSVVTC